MSLVVEFSTITEMFDAITTKYKDSTVPVLKHKVNGAYTDVSYAKLRNDVDLFAFGLFALGVRRGDRIALISENRPEWVVADMGMVMLGAVNVPLYTSLTSEQIKFIFNDAEVSYVIVSTTLQLNKVLKIASEVPSLKNIIVINENGYEANGKVCAYAEVLQKGSQVDSFQTKAVLLGKSNISPDDVLTIIYTSGTTGNPKGVVLTHKNMVSNMVGSAPCIPITPNDVMLSYLPLCHSFERMGGYYTAMACGATIAYAESIDTVRENIIEIKPTIVTSVPRLFEKIYNRLMKQIGDHPAYRQKIFYWAVEVGKKYATAQRKKSFAPWLTFERWVAQKLVYHKITSRTGGKIRFFISGGAALSKELAEFFEAVGILVLEGYGLSEASPVISVNRAERYKFGSVGLPVRNVEVKIAPDGEILARGPNIMKGYWNNERETREVIDTEGWLHTGDIGILDEDGFLHITDRKKHLFVSSGGKNIAPQPIESAFLQSQYIDQFVLIGDKRMFCSALIVPDFDNLRDYARREGLGATTIDGLITEPKVISLFEKELAKHQQHFAQYERVRKFTLLGKALTIESGELTPSLKIRRKIVEERYKDAIETMYEGIE